MATSGDWQHGYRGGARPAHDCADGWTGGGRAPPLQTTDALRDLRQLLLLDHRGGVVERLAEALQHLVDLRAGDDQRRRESEAVAHAASDQAVLLRPVLAEAADAVLRVEGFPRRLVQIGRAHV